MEPLARGDPLVLGRYRLLGRLGAGRTGRVYIGRGPAGTLAAVKVMHARFADDPGFRHRFADEIGFALRVRTGGVAHVIGADPEASQPWVAMEYVPGPSLDTVIAENGPLDQPYLQVLACRLAQTCADLHAQDVAHGDLAPSNVLLAPDRPRLIDFGIARAVGPTSVTPNGPVLGAPGFTSPEQALGEDPGFASDLFSLAGLIVYAATGRGPFGWAANAVAMLRRVVDDEPDLSRVPDELRAVVEPCFAKDPHDRPAVGELTRLLDHHESGPWPPPSLDDLGGTGRRTSTGMLSWWSSLWGGP